MQVRVNGEARELPEGCTVAQLVELCELRPEQVAVELNQRLVRRADRSEVSLSEGDEVELVTLVGGG